MCVCVCSPKHPSWSPPVRRLRMAYNYSKQWLDAQGELVTDLVALARSKDVASVEFDDYDKADAFRFRVRNVLASLALHYPHFKDVTRAIRTWKEIDHSTSIMRIHIGTENNYRAASRATKTPRMVPLRLRGSHPTGPLMGSTSVAQHKPARELVGADPVPPPAEPEGSEDIFVYEDVLSLETAREVLKPILNIVDLRHSMVMEFPNLQMTPDEVRAMADSLEDWAIDPISDMSKLVLRRRSTSDIKSPS